MVVHKQCMLFVILHNYVTYTRIILESPSVSNTGGGEEEVEDADDDVEYNYLADQEVVEKEEFRNDRAVKISSKNPSEACNVLS